MKSFLVLSFITLVCLLSVNAKKHRVTATGRVTCLIDGTAYPVEYVQVRLRDTTAYTQSDGTGWFEVSGMATVDGQHAKHGLFIEVEYEYLGAYGEMKVQKELFRNNRLDKTSTKSFSSSISFGNISFSNDHCRAYVMTYLAMKSYSTLTGKQLPYNRLEVITHAPIHGGTPYSTTDKIRIPSGYNYDLSVAKHELAHTVRHSLDGSFAHFLSDVARYFYMQHHHCAMLTNEGFAFNEGWAEFWGESCYGNYGNSPTEYSYEGNVAKGLRALMSRCGSSYRQMIDVLEGNSGHIHSYIQYEAAYNTLYGCS